MITHQRLSLFVLFLLCIYGKTLWANENTIRVSANHPSFSIQLKSNPTTGYAWSLKSYDKNLFTLEKHAYLKPNNRLVGAPGYEKWIFKTKPAFFKFKKPAALTFSYERPWEKNTTHSFVIYKIIPTS